MSFHLLILIFKFQSLINCYIIIEGERHHKLSNEPLFVYKHHTFSHFPTALSLNYWHFSNIDLLFLLLCKIIPQLVFNFINLMGYNCHGFIEWNYRFLVRKSSDENTDKINSQKRNAWDSLISGLLYCLPFTLIIYDNNVIKDTI